MTRSYAQRQAFTPEEDAYIVAHYTTARLTDMAAFLERNYGSLQAHIVSMVKRGVLEQTQRAYHRPWTPEQRSELEELLEKGLTDAAIGKRLGRSATAVNIARKRSGIPSRGQLLLTARTIRARLGVGCAKTIARWINAGWLKGKRGQRCGPNRMWYITEDALQQFLENPAYWHLWDAKRIPDADVREWAVGLRSERYLTPGEVAKRFYVVHGAVNDWIHRGLLPAVKYGNWHIKESDLVGFVPPGQRSRASA